MFRRGSLFFIHLFFTGIILAQRSGSRPGSCQPQKTPFLPAYFDQAAIPIPVPTPPPKAPRRPWKRDDATCGYFSDDGSPNVCGDNQYCTTVPDGSGGGVWNCCNPDSCYLQTDCEGGNQCATACATSYMSVSYQWYSRFMCATAPGTTLMYYFSADTPSYKSSVEAAQNSAAAASAASASAASAAAQVSYVASLSSYYAAQSAASAASATQAAASAQSSHNAEEASLSAASASAAFASSVAAAQASLSSNLVSQMAASQSAASRSAAQASSNSKTSKTAASVTSSVDASAASGTEGTVARIKHDLSSGAIVGAAVGAVVGSIVLGTVAFILYRVRKKREEDRADVPVMTGTTVMGKGYAGT